MPDERPEDDCPLQGDADEKDHPDVIGIGQQLDEDCRKKRPAKDGAKDDDADVELPALAEQRQNQHGEGNRPDKRHPVSGGVDRGGEKDRCCRNPDRAGGEQLHADAVALFTFRKVEFLLLLPCVLGDKIVHSHTIEVGKLHQNLQVGQRLAAFPFGNRFIGIVDFFRKLCLCQARIPAQLGEVVRNDFFQRIQGLPFSFRVVGFFAARQLLFQLCHGFAQNLRRQQVLPQGKDEVLELPLLVQPRDVLLQRLEPDSDMVIGCKFADFGEDAEGIKQVDDEDAEEGAEEERQHDVIEEPIDDVVENRMDDVAIERAQQRPVERKLGADDALDVPGLLAIVPELDVHSHDENLSCDILDYGHAHADEQHPHQCAGERGKRRKIDGCQAVQHPQSKAIQRQKRANQKARVDPFFGREKTAIEQLENPAQRSTHVKQQHQCQKRSDNVHFLSSAPQVKM